MGSYNLYNQKSKVKPVIALVDCDNFYVSCEIVFNPKLKDKPVVVLSNNDAVVVARSNQAKELGIPMGAPIFKIKPFLEKHNVITIPSNLPLYANMSNRVMNIILEDFPNTEIYSIDEAFINFNLSKTNLEKLFSLQNKILKWTGIPTSIGVSTTKTLAKVATKIAKKKQNQKIHILLDPDEIKNTLSTFDIEDIWGIGNSYSKFLKSHNINTALDLANADDIFIKKHLGIPGLRIAHELRGIQCIDIEIDQKPKKSIMRSLSFPVETQNFDEISSYISRFAEICAKTLRKQNSTATIVSVFISTNPFKENYFSNFISLPLPYPTNSTFDIVNLSLHLLRSIYKPEHLYKRAGVIVSGILPLNSIQQHLFIKPDPRKQILSHLIDKINSRFGPASLHIALSKPPTKNQPLIFEITI